MFQSYLLPLHEKGVPVTDANAAPGMLVKRAYRQGERAGERTSCFHTCRLGADREC